MWAVNWLDPEWVQEKRRRLVLTVLLPAGFSEDVAWKMANDCPTIFEVIELARRWLGERVTEEQREECGMK